MSALTDFAKGFGANNAVKDALNIPRNVNAATYEVREAVQEVKTGATVYAIASLVFQGIMAYAALRSLQLQERKSGQ